MLKKTSLQVKIFLGFFAVIIFYLGLFFIGFYQLDKIRNISEEVVPHIGFVKELNEFNQSLNTIEKDIDKAFIIGSKQYYNDVLLELNDFSNLLKDIDQKVNTDPVLSNLRGSYQKMDDFLLSMLSNFEILSQNQENLVLESKEINEKRILIYENLDILKGSYNELFESSMSALRQDSVAQTGLIFNLARQFLTLGVFIIIFVVLISLLIAQSISKPIKNLSNTVNKIIGGDLTKRAEVTSKDEIGRLAENFNEMTENLILSSEYVNQIIKIMPSSLMIVSAKDGKIDIINEATCKMVSCKSGGTRSLTGKNVSQLFSDDIKDLRSLLDKVGINRKDKKNETVENKRVMMKSVDGELFPVLLSVTSLLSAEGKKSYILAAKDLRELTDYAKRRLSKINPILKKVAMGDFSSKVPVPKIEDEFTEHLVFLNDMIGNLKNMLEEIRNKTSELNKAKTGLEAKVKARTKDLELAKTSLEQKVTERTQELQVLNDKLEDEVKSRTQELQNKLMELERFNSVAVGREIRMVELKGKIKSLEKQLARFTKNK